jgi:hypothetical protein
MQAFLKKHGESFAAHSIKVIWECTLDVVKMEFQVQKRTGPGWQMDSSFGEEWRQNWGLWNKDVVEAFLQLRKNENDLEAPYLELQLSPLNQPFALVITGPRKTFFPPQNLHLKTSVNLAEKLWSATLEVTLPPDLRGEILYGGFFSCLGAGEREFYALNPNPEQVADFHRPDLFLRLGP